MKVIFQKVDPLLKKITIACIGGGVLISIGQACMHTFLCDTYINKIWARYRYGVVAKKLHSKLMPLTTEVLIDLGLKSKIHKFDFFACIGQEPMYLGLYHVHKARIGLPFFFEYLNEKNVDKNELVFFNDQAPDWKKKEGKEFLENLVLSEKAKKYAIAENIALSQSLEYYLKCLTPLIASLFSTVSWYRVEMFMRLKHPNIPAGRRMFFSFSFGIFMFSVWWMATKMAIDEYTREVVCSFLDEIKDKQDYIDGGIEYYTKFQKRNLLFRSFLGENGKNYVKQNGDIVRYISKRFTISEMIETISNYDKHFIKEKK